MHLIVITNELKDSDVEAAGEGHTIFSHAYSVILDVRTPGITVMLCESCRLIAMCMGVQFSSEQYFLYVMLNMD